MQISDLSLKIYAFCLSVQLLFFISIFIIGFHLENDVIWPLGNFAYVFKFLAVKPLEVKTQNKPYKKCGIQKLNFVFVYLYHSKRTMNFEKQTLHLSHLCPEKRMNPFISLRVSGSLVL